MYLKAERAGLQAELDDPETPNKAAIAAQIKALTAQITKKESELSACIAHNTPTPPADPVTHGLLIKAKSSPQVYVIYGGSKLQLRGSQGKDPMAEMGYRATDVLTVGDEAANALPVDRPVDGTLLTSRSGNIYLIEGGKRRLVSAASFKKHGFWKSEVRPVPEATLAALPTGEPLN